MTFSYPNCLLVNEFKKKSLTSLEVSVHLFTIIKVVLSEEGTLTVAL